APATLAISSSTGSTSLFSTAKAHRRSGVPRLHARQQSNSHQRRVVLLVLHREPAGTAEAQRVGIALLAIVAGDQHAGEVVDPFPGHVVQVESSRTRGFRILPLVPGWQARATRFAVCAGR